MKIVDNLADSFVRTFHFEKSRRTGGLLLLLWGLLHLLVGCAHLFLVAAYDLKWSFVLFIPFGFLIMGLIMARAGLRIIWHP